MTNHIQMDKNFLLEYLDIWIDIEDYYGVAYLYCNGYNILGIVIHSEESS